MGAALSPARRRTTTQTDPRTSGFPPGWHPCRDCRSLSVGVTLCSGACTRADAVPQDGNIAQGRPVVTLVPLLPERLLPACPRLRNNTRASLRRGAAPGRIELQCVATGQTLCRPQFNTSLQTTSAPPSQIPCRQFAGRLPRFHLRFSVGGSRASTLCATRVCMLPYRLSLNMSAREVRTSNSSGRFISGCSVRGATHPPVPFGVAPAALATRDELPLVGSEHARLSCATPALPSAAPACPVPHPARRHPGFPSSSATGHHTSTAPASRSCLARRHARATPASPAATPTAQLKSRCRSEAKGCASGLQLFALKGSDCEA